MIELTALTPGAHPPEVADWLTKLDPVRDLLAIADVASSLAPHGRAWAAREAGRVVGVAFAFPLSPTCPSLGVRAETPELERALLQALIAQGHFTDGFVICDPAQRPHFEATGTVNAPFRELQMVFEGDALPPPGSLPDGLVLRPGRFDELDAFYRAEGAGAWNPVQFDTGPYVVIEQGGRVVAAAGTHFAYPGLAQLGNVFTTPAHRGQGLAERVTAAVTRAHLEAGHRTISLFVAEENAGAVRLYERLGYRVRRPLDAFGWRAKGPQA